MHKLYYQWIFETLQVDSSAFLKAGERQEAVIQHYKYFITISERKIFHTIIFKYSFVFKHGFL